MKRFEAKTVEDALELAKLEFECSATEITFEIIQQQANGFLGFWKKNAIIMAIANKKFKKDQNKNFKPKDNRFKKNIQIKEFNHDDTIDKPEEVVVQKPEPKIVYNFDNDPKLANKEPIFENFYDASNNQIIPKIRVKKSNEQIVGEIIATLNLLFVDFCYKLNPIKVEFYDDETIYIEFNGEDAALLIGKEGYRYKALSYILFNWINEHYGLMVRLEVAEFLQNQEEAIFNYLEPLIEQIKQTGSGKTKILDGVLAHIALKKLRTTFPEKYVASKTNPRGEKYILVNEYRQS